MDKDAFEILRLLAKGGQKVVYLAQNRKDHSVVLIKEAQIASMSSWERIGREINLLSQLDSEFFPKNYGSNFDIADNKFTIIEEYIEGEPSRNVMKNYNDWSSIKTLIINLIDGLSIVWDKNIVHRDLKPENIIIRPNGKPCIIDFGIARFLEKESLTNTLQMYGPCSLGYASPEQLNNEKNIIDQRTDFFALGIMILEMYLGEHPFSPQLNEGTMSIVENILANKYVLSTPSKAENPNISALCRRLLQTQPYNRFRNYLLFKQFIETSLV